LNSGLVVLTKNLYKTCYRFAYIHTFKLAKTTKSLMHDTKGKSS